MSKSHQTGATSAYDQEGVAAAVAERCPAAAIIMPPRSTAVPSEIAETTPTQRDRHLQSIAQHGRAAWQKASGYTRRARAEAAIGRFKQVIGDGLRSARTGAGRPRWTSPSMRSTVCWSWDARSPSVSPEPQPGLGQLRPLPGSCNAASCAGVPGARLATAAPLANV